MQKGEVYNIGKLNDSMAYFRHLLPAIPASNVSSEFFFFGHFHTLKTLNL